MCHKLPLATFVHCQVQQNKYVFCVQCIRERNLMCCQSKMLNLSVTFVTVFLPENPVIYSAILIGQNETFDDQRDDH